MRLLHTMVLEKIEEVSIIRIKITIDRGFGNDDFDVLLCKIGITLIIVVLAYVLIFQHFLASK